MPPNIGTLCFKNGFTICESRQFYCCYYPDDWSAVVLRFGVKIKRPVALNDVTRTSQTPDFMIFTSARHCVYFNESTNDVDNSIC